MFLGRGGEEGLELLAPLGADHSELPVAEEDDRLALAQRGQEAGQAHALLAERGGGVEVEPVDAAAQREIELAEAGVGPLLAADFPSRFDQLWDGIAEAGARDRQRFSVPREALAPQRIEAARFRGDVADDQ